MESWNSDAFLESFLSDFFDKFCQLFSPPNELAMDVLIVQCGYFTTNVNPLKVRRDKLTCTGSAVEFYLNLPLSCIEDIDQMVTRPGIVAIPERCAEIRKRSDDEIVTLAPVENHPGFVKLVVGVSEERLSDNRVRCTVEIISNTTESGRQWLQFVTKGDASNVTRFSSLTKTVQLHSAAVCAASHLNRWVDLRTGVIVGDTASTTDFVCSVPCQVWAPEASEWVSRKRRYSWPSETNIRHITLGGCDVVPVAHRYCKHDMNQWRLSLSRAEVILLNS